MELKLETIHRLLVEPQCENGDWQYCGSYGEPGYQDSTTTAVVLGNYWCKCGNHPHTGQPKGYSYPEGTVIKAEDLHDLGSHHPRVWAAAEAAGVQFEWSDEWIIDYDNDKAYRTSPDSYSWKQSYRHHGGDIITPDDDIETWIEYCLDADDGGSARCLPRHIYNGADLEAAGFVKWNGQYESGWHQGMDADPNAITAQIKAQHPDDDIVFMLDEASQFYITFSAYHREAGWGDEPETLSNHYSTDDQLKDVVSWLQRERPGKYAAFLVAFPEWNELVWEGSWLDAEASGVDAEYTSWAIDWIESHTTVIWDDGEPWSKSLPSEDDDDTPTNTNLEGATS